MLKCRLGLSILVRLEKDEGLRFDGPRLWDCLLVWEVGKAPSRTPALATLTPVLPSHHFSVNHGYWQLLSCLSFQRQSRYSPSCTRTLLSSSQACCHCLISHCEKHPILRLRTSKTGTFSPEYKSCSRRPSQPSFALPVLLCSTWSTATCKKKHLVAHLNPPTVCRDTKLYSFSARPSDNVPPWLSHASPLLF